MKGTDVLSSAINFGAESKTIALLMKAGANLRYAAPPMGISAIAMAISNGNVPAIELLLDADPTLIEATFINDVNCRVWMMFCSAQAPLAVFNLMHDRYPQQLPRMMTAFPTHGGVGQGAVAQLSLFHGGGDAYDAVMDTGLPFCDPNVSSDIRVGVMKMIVRACDLLVRVRRYDPGFITMMSYSSRCAAIHVAAYLGNLGVLEKLIERKVDINSTEHHWKMTPLHLAVISGHEAICARLVSLGAAIETKDKRGRTALNWAKRLDREDIMQLLLAAMRRKQVSGAPRATARV